MLPSDAFFQQPSNSELLQQQLQKLQIASPDIEKGLSNIFHKTVHNEETIAAMCTQAMQQLATEYVHYLELIDSSTSPTEILTLLNSAESIWMEASKIIRQYDLDGKEASFLLAMRRQAQIFLERKLMQASKKCTYRATEENISLCLGLLAVLDYISFECGESIESVQRKRYRTMANNYR